MRWKLRVSALHVDKIELLSVLQRRLKCVACGQKLHYVTYHHFVVEINLREVYVSEIDKVHNEWIAFFQTLKCIACRQKTFLQYELHCSIWSQINIESCKRLKYIYILNLIFYKYKIIIFLNVIDNVCSHF